MRYFYSLATILFVGTIAQAQNPNDSYWFYRFPCHSGSCSQFNWVICHQSFHQSLHQPQISKERESHSSGVTCVNGLCWTTTQNSSPRIYPQSTRIVRRYGK